MWQLLLRHLFIFKHLLLLLMVLQFKWPLAQCDVNSLPVPSTVSNFPSRDLLTQSSTFSPELTSRESDINLSLENYLHSQEKTGKHGGDYSQEYPVSTEVPNLHEELPKPQELAIRKKDQTVVQVADLNVPAESQISAPVLANQIHPKSDIVYMQGFNPVTTPQERTIVRHSMRKRIRVPVYTTVYGNHRVISDRPRARGGRGPRRPRGRRVKRRRRGRNGRGRRPPPLRHMATHQLPAYTPAFVSYGPVFGPPPLSNQPQMYGTQTFPIVPVPSNVMGSQNNVMYVPVLHQGPGPGPTAHGHHIMVPTTTHAPPSQPYQRPIPQPTYLPPNALPPPDNFKYPSITISVEADSNHVQSPPVSPNRHPLRHGSTGHGPGGQGLPYGSISAPTNFPPGFGPLPSYSNHQSGKNPLPAPANQTPAYGVAIPTSVPSNNLANPTVTPPIYGPPVNLYPVAVPVPHSKPSQFAQTNIPFVPLPPNNPPNFGIAHGPHGFEPLRAPQAYGPTNSLQSYAFPTMSQTYSSHIAQQPFASHNAPQPFASHNAPKPFASHNAPQPFASHNAPQPFSSHNVPQTFSSHNAPQPYGSENLIQPYQSSGSQHSDHPKGQAYSPPNEPPMNFGHPMHNFGPPKSSLGQPPPIMGDSNKDPWAPPIGFNEYPGGQGFINDPPSKSKYHTNKSSHDQKSRDVNKYNNFDQNPRDEYSSNYDHKLRDQSDYSYDRKNQPKDNYISTSNKYPKNNDIANDNHPARFFNPPKELKDIPGPSFHPPASRPFFDTSEFHNDYTTQNPPRRYRKRRPKTNSPDSQSTSPSKNTYWAGETQFDPQNDGFWKEPWGSYHQREPNSKSEQTNSIFDYNSPKAKLPEPSIPSFDNQAVQNLGSFDGFQNQPKKRPRMKNTASTSQDSRPHPSYDTNYNSPGMSKDPKVTDWMTYGEYTDKEKLNMGYPRRHRKKVNKYSTLPQSFDNLDPDPNHIKYPKLTYDSLSRRILPEHNGPDFIPQDTKHSLSKTGDEFQKMLKHHDNMRI
ncbi:unnamed protein product [Allacma fusca]|uniref:Uncharacterized protein n=1 Tax=Allacma fusca TaxID=39272 RepID=A0A8J2PDF5_9HEXA|nr:unnamed protein product [Allacma fusca]